MTAFNCAPYPPLGVPRRQGCLGLLPWGCSSHRPRGNLRLSTSSFNPRIVRFCCIDLIVSDLLTLEHESQRLHILSDTFSGVPLLVLSQVQGYSIPLFKGETLRPAAVLTLPATTADIRAAALSAMHDPDS